MAERRENSVLFSLKELRNIEDGRVQKEKDDARSRMEAERAAQEASARAAREGEERVRREEEDRLRRIEDEKESRSREEQIRLQEAERRARVEGEVRLQEQRMHLDAQAKRETKSPLKAILGVTGVLVVVAGGLGYKMYSDHQQALIDQRNELQARAEAEAKAAQVEFDRRLGAITKDMNDKLASAKTEEDKARIRAEAAQQRAAAAASSRSGHRASSEKPAAPSAPNYHKVEKRTIDDDPLKGL
jgi:hypothetical protein